MPKWFARETPGTEVQELSAEENTVSIASASHYRLREENEMLEEWTFTACVVIW
jgi:hypothetical protein